LERKENMNTQNQEFIDRAEAAFNRFCILNPDFIPSDASASLLGEAVQRLKLPLDRVESLTHAWITIRPRPKSTPARKPAQAPAAALAPEPLEAAIEKEAIRLLDSGEVDETLARLSATQFEHRCHNLAFVRALEIREERRAKSVLLARGDLIQAEQRSRQQGTSPVFEIAKAEQRMIAAQNPNPYSPNAARRSGIVSTHDMTTSSTRRKPTLEAALAQERKDQAFLDAAAAKTARLIRYKANRGK
jgi:hypothetical protein